MGNTILARRQHDGGRIHLAPYRLESAYPRGYSSTHFQFSTLEARGVRRPVGVVFMSCWRKQSGAQGPPRLDPRRCKGSLGMAPSP